MNLPKGKYSFLLQKWVGASACEEAYSHSLWLLNEILCLNLHGTQSQRIVENLSLQVDMFYFNNPVVKNKEEGEYLCIGADGKGVPIISDQRDAPSEEAQQEKTRLMKGQKRGIKKEATVVTTFSFNGEARTNEEVVKSLHNEWNIEEKKAYKEKILERGEKPREAKNIHKRAFISHQKLALEYGVQNIILRDPTLCKPIVALVDGDRGLEKGIREYFDQYGISMMLDAVILDIIHVSEYVWKAANAYLGEKNPGRNKWVRSKLLDILDSKTEQVLKELERIRDDDELSNAAKEKIGTTIKYFQNHRHKMDYKKYLEKGYPISTGLVESTCGHLVKDRMEMSGMRWGINGAQNMLNIRAVKKNKDWNKFIDFVKESNKQQFVRLVA